MFTLSFLAFFELYWIASGGLNSAFCLCPLSSYGYLEKMHWWYQFRCKPVDMKRVTNFAQQSHRISQLLTSPLLCVTNPCLRAPPFSNSSTSFITDSFASFVINWSNHPPTFLVHRHFYFPENTVVELSVSLKTSLQGGSMPSPSALT